MKQNKNIKVYLDDKTVDMIKRINALDDFCSEQNIVLYYFNPSENKFYTRKSNVFTESNLNLFENISQVSESIKIKANFLNKKKERQLEENENFVKEYNQKFYSKNLNESDFIFQDNDKKFDFRIIFKFIKENCDEGKINTFIFLEKELENTLRYIRKDKIIILCLCMEKENDYKIKTVIYKDYMFEYNKIQNKKFIDSFEIDVKDYDLLVWIQFNKFKIRGKIYEYQ